MCHHHFCVLCVTACLCSRVKAGRAKCSKVWAYFAKFNENTDKCNKYKTVVAFKGNTSTLMKHNIPLQHPRALLTSACELTLVSAHFKETLCCFFFSHMLFAVYNFSPVCPFQLDYSLNTRWQLLEEFLWIDANSLRFHCLPGVHSTQKLLHCNQWIRNWCSHVFS